MYTKDQYRKKYRDYLWRLGQEIAEGTDSQVVLIQEQEIHFSASLEKCNEKLSQILISAPTASSNIDYQFKLSFGCPMCCYLGFYAELNIVSWEGIQFNSGLVRDLAGTGLLNRDYALFRKRGLHYRVCAELDDCKCPDDRERFFPHTPTPPPRTVTYDIKELIVLLKKFSELSSNLGIPIDSMLYRYRHAIGQNVEHSDFEGFTDWAIKTFKK